MRRYSSITGGLLRVSLDVIIVSLVLFALLPAKKLITVETAASYDQIQAAQDESCSVALVHSVADPRVPSEVVYLVLKGATRFDESPFVSTHCYRGPPILS
ncbi:MAG: hypothetical protein ABSD38_29095 [Syntrophorhabdales bacterium]|jgi:hypothetical protein